MKILSTRRCEWGCIKWKIIHTICENLLTLTFPALCSVGECFCFRQHPTLFYMFVGFTQLQRPTKSAHGRAWTLRRLWQTLFDKWKVAWAAFFLLFLFSSLQNTSLSSAERVVGCTQWQKVFPFSTQEGKFYIFFEIYIFHSHFALPSSFPLFPVPLTLLPESTISLSPHSKYRKRSKKKIGASYVQVYINKKAICENQKVQLSSIFPFLLSIHHQLHPRSSRRLVIKVSWKLLRSRRKNWKVLCQQQRWH